jgi:uncharacterized small protein (DUF1192 family)
LDDKQPFFGDPDLDKAIAAIDAEIERLRSELEKEASTDVREEE